MAKDKNNVLFDSERKTLIVEHLYTVEDYSTFRIKVKSGDFTGASNFTIPKEQIVTTIETLSGMYSELKGCCKVNDYDSDAYILIEMVKLGHMFVSGQIGGSHEDHNMKFNYSADQTLLVSLRKIFKAVL